MYVCRHSCILHSNIAATKFPLEGRAIHYANSHSWNPPAPLTSPQICVHIFQEIHPFSTLNKKESRDMTSLQYFSWNLILVSLSPSLCHATQKYYLAFSNIVMFVMMFNMSAHYYYIMLYWKQTYLQQNIKNSKRKTIRQQKIGCRNNK